MPAPATTTRLRFQNGYAIRALRVKSGLTQDELAGRVGIRQATLSAIETEAAEAQLGTLEDIAGALSIPVSAILREHTIERAVITGDAA